MASEIQYLVYEGEFFTIEFYFTEDLEIPIWSHYTNLSEEEKTDFFVRVQKLANSKPGTVHPKTIFNLEDKQEKIYAIKFGQNRFCSFFAKDKRIIITNSYVKKSQKNTKKITDGGLKKAKSYKDDYETRSKNKNYYKK